MHDNGAHNDGSSGDDLFGARIPAFSKDIVVDYYVTATDNLGSQSTDPVTAPDMTYSYVVGYVPPLLYINEFMADNDGVIPDPNDPNSFEDWIELYNASENTIDLSGMYITDDLTNPTKWLIPAGISIPSGGYLLFWADNDDEEGSTHTNFNLNKDGEDIGLFDTDTKGNIIIDTISFGDQSMDISYGRENDGGEAWVFFESSTPGYSNNSTNFYLELDAGWSMISLPVMSHNLKLSELFPDAMVVYGFEKEKGYIRVAEEDYLEVGKGYWILLNESRGYTLTGHSIIDYTQPVYRNGWYMIGACTSLAQALVTNCGIEVIYAFDKEFGYKRILASENLEPGKGYWILLGNTFGQAELKVEIIGSQ
jgi:hypothetical protein